MKPMSPDSPNKRRFPLTDYSFQSRFGDWHGYSFYDDDSEFRKFRDLSREFLMESARERAKEMAVFIVIVLAALWPVIYMIVTVVKLLLKGRPLD